MVMEPLEEANVVDGAPVASDTMRVDDDTLATCEVASKPCAPTTAARKSTGRKSIGGCWMLDG